MWMATVWRISAIMDVTVPYSKVLFSVLYFLTSQSEIEFGIALVFTRGLSSDNVIYGVCS